MDASLSLRARLALFAHLAGCRACRRYARQLQLLRQAWMQHVNTLTVGRVERLPEPRRDRIKELLRHVR